MENAHFEVFACLITGVYRDIQKLKLMHTRELSLKNVHIFWLYLLMEHPEGLSASELARASRSTRSLVSREIEELAERGLVTVAGQTERRRYGWKFMLTDSGRVLAQRIGQIALNVQERVSAGIPEDELCVFYRTLNRLLDNFDDLVSGQPDETGEGI